MLKISGDGRAAALDVRLVGLDEPLGATKVTTAAKRIHQMWQATRDRRFNDPSGNLHPRPGGLQLVFAELGTPGGKRWGRYEQLRTELTARGVPAEQVRFMHEARNAREKEQLFADCRNGNVSVLIGTTEKMGVGTNVQARCVALHHLDCPPTSNNARAASSAKATRTTPSTCCATSPPAASTCPCGKPSNSNPGSSTRCCPAAGARNIDDIASEQELLRRRSQSTRHRRRPDRSQSRPRHRRRPPLPRQVGALRGPIPPQRIVTRGVERRSHLNTAIDVLTALDAHRIETRGDRFHAVIDGRCHDTRSDAGTQTLMIVDAAMRDARHGAGTHRTAFTVGGVDIERRCSSGGADRVEISIPKMVLRFFVDRDDLETIEPAKLAVRLENLVHKIPDAIAADTDELAHPRNQHHHSPAAPRCALPSIRRNSTPPPRTSRHSTPNSPATATAETPPGPPTAAAIAASPDDRRQRRQRCVLTRF